MISYVAGNLFESPAQTLVNTVNTVGVMGKGVALNFKRIYPEMFREYRELCEEGRIEIGSLHLYRTPHKNVLNFPTKRHWRQPSKPEYIEAGLTTFVQNYEKMKIRSVAFPPLGCGNGELDFARVVQPIMEEYLRDLPIPVFIYAPMRRAARPEHREPDEIRAWLRSYPSELPVAEVWEDLRAAFRTRRTLRTLSHRPGEFEAEYAVVGDNEEGIRIRAAGKTEVLRADEFLETWKQLRDAGFVTTRGNPGHRERLASYIFPALAVLPYVEPVGLSQDFASFQFGPSIGLQLAPSVDTGRSEPRQLELI
jgi:O-acetyl-ADP-ribose deacetylase (regulator of RNase III)